MFDIATNQWSSAPVTGNVDGLVGPSLASVSITGLGLSFALGPDEPGLTRFDATRPTSLTWTNQTTRGPQGIDPPLVYGDSELIYVPLGAEGILLVFGSSFLVCSVGFLKYKSANSASRIQLI